MKLHPFVYVLVGTIVSIFSWLIDKATDSKKLAIFFYLGIALIGFGLIRFFILGKPTDKIESKRPEPRFGMNCPRCKQQVNVFDNFCSKCGMYLKARR